ncbi:MAG: methyltransferase domain-containing protein [Ruminobacter sp.]|nr:methyltransferase domain-containing protein [Ruminobacter sp.]
MNNRSQIYKTNLNLNNIGDPRVIALSYISDNCIILDVGCACGDFGVALKEHRNATMYGLEYNQSSIDIALETGAYESIHQFNLDEITDNSFSQYSGKFDYIVCGDVLEHLRYPMYSLNILKSYLKEDGRIIASIPNIAHMSIKSNLLVNDFTYTPFGLLDETHIHLFTHKSISSGLSSIGLKVEECKFTFHNKVAWQPNDPYSQLSDDIKYYLFKDWHSFVCQYVMTISKSKLVSEEILKHNYQKLIINETNAPDYIKNYRDKVLAELTNTTGQKLDNNSQHLTYIEENIKNLFGELNNTINITKQKLDNNSKKISYLEESIKRFGDIKSNMKIFMYNLNTIQNQISDLEVTLAEKQKFELKERELCERINKLKNRRKLYKTLFILSALILFLLSFYTITQL